jgi:hypothetical protein
MTLATDEFIRRFLIHVLPHGFHRIRHYGLFASASRADNLARVGQLLAAPAPQTLSDDAQAAAAAEPQALSHPCPCCGCRMIIIETFERGATPRHQPTAPVTASSGSTPHDHLSIEKRRSFRPRCSTGHGTARPDSQLSPQIAQTFAMLVAARRSFSSRCTLRQLAPSHHRPSAAACAAPKSP